MIEKTTINTINYPHVYVSQYNPVKGLGSWLTPDLYRVGGALGYKSTGRSHIYDSKKTINTINLPSGLYAPPVNLDTMCSTCKS